MQNKTSKKRITLAKLKQQHEECSTHRNISTYSANHTASLALMNKAAPEDYLSYFKKFFNEKLDKLTSTKKNKVRPTVAEETALINQKMQTLEKQIQNLHAEKRILIKKIETAKQRDAEAKIPNKNVKHPRGKIDPILYGKFVELMKKLDALQLQKILLVSELIKEHAARRVDLFFYLLVALYKTNLKVGLAVTKRQYGKGSKLRGTEACHSSLFPWLSISIDNQTKAKVALKFFSGKNNNIQPVETFLETFFQKDAANMTIELPTTVNDLDSLLEARDSFLNILNNVSVGTYDPISGMKMFFEQMNNFFEKLKSKYIDNAPAPNVNKNYYPETFKQIWQIEKEGTFAAASNDFSLQNDYIATMLKIHGMNPTGKFKFHFWDKQEVYETIQNEIYTNKSYR